MNSTYHGMAVTEEARWLNPQGGLSDVQKPEVQIYGKKLNRLSKKQIQMCPTEKERYAHPYTIKPNKRNRRRTIYTNPKNGESYSVHPTV